MWFAWKFLSLWYQTQQSWILLLEWLCCDLLENFYLCGIKHNPNEQRTRLYGLWFAWKFLSLWYQTQLQIDYNILLTRCDLLENFYLCGIKHNTRSKMVQKFQSCDLLENFYLCGIKHNNHRNTYHYHQVVICLKISIFVVSNTTLHCSFLLPYQLWFAWKFLSLWYQTQPEVRIPGRSLCCDLLENFYLCGIKHNIYQFHHSMTCVVICLKISIFVVSNTTITMPFGYRSSCDLLENFYLCGIKHNFKASFSTRSVVVICLKISIFVVSNTTRCAPWWLDYRLWFAWKFLSLWYQTQQAIKILLFIISCDLLENFYLCGIKHNVVRLIL